MATFWIVKLFAGISVLFCFQVANYDAKDAWDRYYWESLAGNTPQLIQLRGFIPEEHSVVTPDGYVLRIFRVVNVNRHGPNGTRHGYPLIIFQGLFMASEAFQDNSDGLFSPQNNVYSEFEDNFTRLLQLNCPAGVKPDRAGRNLPYTLATCGFDIYLANVRDARGYATHLLLDPEKDPQYWNINLDSYTIDAKSIIDYVLVNSRASSVGTICHSIGCNTLFQLLAEYSDYNHLLKPVFALAPYVFTQHTGSVPLTLPAIFEPILSNLLMRTPDISSIRPFISDLIRRNKLVKDLFLLLFSTIGGLNVKELDLERIYRITAHFPGTVAARVFAHIGQRRLSSGPLFKYDFGSKQNVRVYGMAIPPAYNLEAITNRYIVVFRGGKDFLADAVDLDRLIGALKVQLFAQIVTDYSHSDFILSRHCNVTVNMQILDVLHRLQLNYN